jgi:CheY-like chemotaxis protein
LGKAETFRPSCPENLAGLLTKQRTSRKRAIPSFKILVADDEFLIRWSLTQALGQEGYEVTAVEDGRKAVEAARSQHFDFIITDLIMPELDGWEVLQMANQSQPPPRVIIITARGNEDTGKLARERGAWAYVEKPYIIEKIKEILSSSVPSSSPNLKPE